jgi:hypothetical protein
VVVVRWVGMKVRVAMWRLSRQVRWAVAGLRDRLMKWLAGRTMRWSLLGLVVV